MRVKSAQILALGLAVISAVATAACDNACRELSQEICSCESTQRGQSACLQLLDGRSSNRDPSTEQLEQCSELIDSCTCEALAEGDYAACGLSQE